MWKKCRNNKNFVIGFGMVAFLGLLLLLSFIYLPYDPNEMDTLNSFQAPSAAHLLGTDNFGRDIFSRIVKGSQTAFLVGITAVAIGMAVGVILGAAAGYFQGWID